MLVGLMMRGRFSASAMPPAMMWLQMLVRKRPTLLASQLLFLTLHPCNRFFMTAAQQVLGSFS